MLSPHPRKRARLSDETPICNNDNMQTVTRSTTAVESGKDGDSNIDSSQSLRSNESISKMNPFIDGFSEIIIDEKDDATQQEKKTVASTSFNTHGVSIGRRCVTYWVQQAAQFLATQLRSFDPIPDPSQIPNSVLTSVSNELAERMKWFGLKTQPSTDSSFIDVTCESMLRLLDSIVSECGALPSHHRDNYDVQLDSWTNALFAQSILLRSDHDELDSWVQAPQHEDDNIIFILEVVSMIRDIFLQLWKRIQQITTTMRMLERPTPSEFTDEALNLIESLVSQPSQTAESNANVLRAFLVLHVPFLWNDDIKFLQNTKIPIDFHNAVRSVLTRSLARQQETERLEVRNFLYFYLDRFLYFYLNHFLYFYFTWLCFFISDL